MAPIAADGTSLLADVATIATRTTPLLRSPILERQAPTVTVVSSGDSNNNGGSGLGTGSIAAIILGTVLGIILVWGIIRWSNSKQSDGDAAYHSGRPHRDYHYAHDTAHPRSRSRRASVETRTSTIAQPVRYPAEVYDGGRQHRSRGRSSGRY